MRFSERLDRGHANLAWLLWITFLPSTRLISTLVRTLNPSQSLSAN
jgi:hypothetical protein